MKKALLTLFTLLLTVTCAWAGATYTSPKFTATDSNGVPLSGGKLYTYKPGTVTDKATYSDKTLVTANANPVVLDSRGEADVYGEGRYKFVLKDSSDTTIWTVDNVDGKGEKVLTSIGDYGDSLNTAIATIGATETTLVIDTDVTLTANATVPATMELVFTRGGTIALNSKTLVVNGYIRSGTWDIITGTGTFTYNITPTVSFLERTAKGEPGSSDKTLTAAMLVGGVVDEDPEGAATWTTDTAVNIVAGINDCVVGTTFRTVLYNDATNGSTEAVTIAAGVGVTLHGESTTLTEGTCTVGELVFRVTNVTSGSQAVDCYILKAD